MTTNTMTTIDIQFCIQLTKKLIQCKSITPNEGGALNLLQNELESIGFSCKRMPFSETKNDTVDNLFAKYGKQKPNLAFAGHTDVVPPGDESKWIYPPFNAHQNKNTIYGRGAVDMKGAIACWITATKAYLKNNKPTGSLSLIITGDEEGISINGTRKMLTQIQKNNDTPTACITGEPTSSENVGDTIKHGRRGSSNFSLTVNGTAGHTGYPHLADNAAHKIITALNNLTQWKLDDGNNDFEPSHLSITNINVNNKTTNIIPDQASAQINVRFNTLHSTESIQKNINSIIQKNIKSNQYTLNTISASNAFVTQNTELQQITSTACQNVTQNIPEFSTKGGTSDSRFIKEYCPVVDLGLIGKSMHQNNEAVTTQDLQILTEIYLNIITEFFKYHEQ